MKNLIQKNPSIVMRHEDDGALLYNQNDGTAYSINESGLIIWELCDGNRSRMEIEQEIKTRFSLKEDEVHWVKEFINYLFENHLIIELGMTLKSTTNEKHGIENWTGINRKQGWMYLGPKK